MGGVAFIRNLVLGQTVTEDFAGKKERYLVVRTARLEPGKIWRARLVRIRDEEKFTIEYVEGLMKFTHIHEISTRETPG